MTDDLDPLFNRLHGQWELEREVAGIGKFYGVCVFAAESPRRLVCEERGAWDMGEGGLEASRSYIYEFDRERRRIIIFYNDPHRKGEVLHELDFIRDGAVLWSAHCHVCGEDRYDLRIMVEDGGRIFMDYVVKGPKKDYQMKTVLKPIPH